MPKPIARPKLDVAALEGVDGMGDATPETREKLADLARIEALPAGRAASAFALALVTEGHAVIRSAEDQVITSVGPGVLVSTHGTLRDGSELEIVAGPEGARVALWARDAIDAALAPCPWVVEELAGSANRLMALAGATTGELGELEPSERARLFDVLGIVVARPGERVTSDTAPAAVVCAGSVQVAEGDEGVVVASGSVLFPRAEAQAGLVGMDGALLLVGDATQLALLADESPQLATLLRQG